MAALSAKTSFLAAMGSLDPSDTLTAWWSSCGSSADLPALVVGLDTPALNRSLASLAPLVRAAAASLGGGENASPQGSERPLSILRCAAALCCACLEGAPGGGGGGGGGVAPRGGAAPLMAAVQALHDALLVMPREGGGREGASALSLAQRACERAWALALPGAAAATPLALMLLLSELAEPTAAAGGGGGVLKRLWALRGALRGVDWEAPDSAGLLELLLRCFVNPAVLRAEAGRRFLGAAMACSAPLALRCHATVRAAFPLPPRRWPEWVADVYARAWAAAAADAGGGGGEAAAAAAAAAAPLPRLLETRVLQDLLFKGMHAAVPAVFASVRAVAGAWAAGGGGGKGRGGEELAALLARCYAPILWRALESPNDALRRNAATLFRDAFPLAPSVCPLAEQVAALTALGDDGAPAVRELGVGFISEALARHWAAFPALARSRLLARLAARAEDGAAPGVRAAAVRGLAALLAAAPGSHGAAAASGALAAAARHVGDRNDRVRAAAVELLGVVAAYRGSFPEGPAPLAGGEE